jgi:2'-5' RNA ligase
MSKTTYYSGVKILVNLNEKITTTTNMHMTVWFKHDASDEDLEYANQQISLFNLTGKKAKIVRFDCFNGIEVCILDFEPALKERLTLFNDEHSWRRNIDTQYTYTPHCSMGKLNTDENHINKVLVGGIGSEVIFGDVYIKNLDNKEIIWTKN